MTNEGRRGKANKETQYDMHTCTCALLLDWRLVFNSHNMWRCSWQQQWLTTVLHGALLCYRCGPLTSTMAMHQTLLPQAAHEQTQCSWFTNSQLLCCTVGTITVGFHVLYTSTVYHFCGIMIMWMGMRVCAWRGTLYTPMHMQGAHGHTIISICRWEGVDLHGNNRKLK